MKAICILTESIDIIGIFFGTRRFQEVYKAVTYDFDLENYVSEASGIYITHRDIKHSTTCITFNVKTQGR